MDYYEELGIAANASEDEIRRAYRRMTKLLHPDQQTDEGVKQLAEVQMRRLNSIVDVLLDPERRREYDEHLRKDIPYYEGARASVSNVRRKRSSWPWWVASTVGAVVLTLVVVWFWASNLGSSFGSHAPTYIPSDGRDAPASAATNTPKPEPKTETETKGPADSVPAIEGMLPSKTVTKVPPAANEPSSAPRLPNGDPDPPSRKTLVLPNEPILAQAHPAPVNLPPPPVSIPSGSRADTASLPVATLPTAAGKPPLEAQPTTRNAENSTSPKPAASDPLEGEWIYAPAQPEKKKAGFYPPEYISLKLFRNGGRLYGQ